jgi:predicted DNA-binding protein (MmcQ/YjbR family)
MTERHPRIEIDVAIMVPLRAICLPYPEASEAEAFGNPTFQINRKNFAMANKLDHRVSIWCKASPGAQEAFVASEPEHYFRPPYLGPKGWIGAWLSPETAPDWDAIAEIIDESYRLIAPKRLLKLLDSNFPTRQ